MKRIVLNTGALVCKRYTGYRTSSGFYMITTRTGQDYLIRRLEAVKSRNYFRILMDHIWSVFIALADRIIFPFGKLPHDQCVTEYTSQVFKPDKQEVIIKNNTGKITERKLLVFSQVKTLNNNREQATPYKCRKQYMFPFSFASSGFPFVHIFLITSQHIPGLGRLLWAAYCLNNNLGAILFKEREKFLLQKKKNPLFLGG